MKTEYAVVGLGAMGSAACYHLAKRGLAVTGFDRFSSPNDRGSSHGETRMIRQAYFEHPDYVPLLRRAYQLWDELAAETRRSLFHRTGIVYGARPTSEVAQGMLRSARKYQIELHTKAASDFPAMCFPEGLGVYWEPDAGYLEVENCIKAHVDRAREMGADLHEHTEVQGFRLQPVGIAIDTNRGTWTAKKMIIAAGPWVRDFVKNTPVTVHRVTQHWFAPKSGAIPDTSFAFDLPGGFFYGFPQIAGLCKVGFHAPGIQVADALTVSRSITDGDRKPVTTFVAEHLPGLNPIPVRSSVCLYSMTSDSHFIVDFHEQSDDIVVASGFSGHGFKFASVLGEALADLAHKKNTSYPIGFLGRGRFQK